MDTENALKTVLERDLLAALTRFLVRYPATPSELEEVLAQAWFAAKNPDMCKVNDNQFIIH